MGFYNHNWNYSHQDKDVGDILNSSKRYRRLSLRMRKQIVDRELEVLWQRSGYHTIDLKESFGGNFAFKIERNPIVGVHYKNLAGYVLWRTWYRVERTPTGGLHFRKDPDEELVAVVLSGSPIWRMPSDGPTVTDRMRSEFSEAFSSEVVTLDELIDRKGL